MKIETKFISPKMAEEMLGASAPNRGVMHSRVLTLANEMRQGKWQLNGETVVVADSGRLIDGQHRLFAIIEYGSPIQMIIVTGVAESSFETIDTGRTRTAGDILGMAGYANGNISAAAAAMIWRLFHNASHRDVCVPFMVLEVVKRFPAIDKWAPFVANMGHKTRSISGGPFLTAITYLEDVAKKPLAAERFFNGMTKGADLKEGDPILTLRNRLLNMRASGAIMNAQTTWTSVARTLTALEAGELLYKMTVEKATGTVRRPALWAEHVKALPKDQQLTYLWPAKGSGGRAREQFKESIKDIRGGKAA